MGGCGHKAERRVVNSQGNTICLDCNADASRRKRRRQHGEPVRDRYERVEPPVTEEALPRMEGRPYGAGDACPHCRTRLLGSYDQDGDITCFACGWVGTPTEMARTCSVCRQLKLTVLDERELPVCKGCWSARVPGSRSRRAGRA